LFRCRELCRQGVVRKKKAKKKDHRTLDPGGINAAKFLEVRHQENRGRKTFTRANPRSVVGGEKARKSGLAGLREFRG